MHSSDFVPWGNVTDPNYHDPENYRYLIHIDSGRRNPAKDRRVHFIDDIAAITNPLGSGHQRSKYPRPVLCSSLVSHNRAPLFDFAAHGFVIEVPEEAVIATSPIDIVLIDADMDDIAKRPQLDPDTLLEETDDFKNNEVVLAPGLVVVRAIVNLSSEQYRYHSRRRTPEELREKSEEYCLPLINL